MRKGTTHKKATGDLAPSGHRLVNNKFSMQLPQTWEDKSVYMFEGPVEDGIKHNIWVTLENDAAAMDLERYAQVNIQAVRNELQGYTELKQGPLILENRQPAYEHVYKWSPVQEREIYQRVLYVLSMNTGYILTATFSKKTWKLLAGEVDKILMSFTAG